MESIVPKFSKDKPIMLTAGINCIVALLTVLVVFGRLRSHDFKVPVQYIVHDGSVFQTGSWYSLYSLALLSVLGVGAILYLSYQLHKGNRLFSLGILMGYTVINIFSLLVTVALLGLVSKV